MGSPMLPGAIFLAVSLIEVPATRVTVIDGATSVPVTVRIRRFAISGTEVTQGDYERITGSNPAATHRGADLPVHSVTWHEAIRFCNLLSERESLAPAYDLAAGSLRPGATGYRLPTSMEWSEAAGPASAAGAHLGHQQTKDTAPLLEWLRSAGPKPPATLPANALGGRGIFGNVWEWVHDWADPSGAISAADDPTGPPTGVAREIRGGAYSSPPGGWTKGFRSSQDPNRRSPYTGFRVCRTVPGGAAEAYAADWFAPYQQSVPGAMAAPSGSRDAIESRWNAVLGTPSTSKPPVEARLIRRDETPLYTAEMRELRVEADYWEKIYVMLPRTAPARRLPVVIVPYYDVDTPAGASLGGRLHTPPGTRSFAYLAVQQGFAAVAIRWYGESYGESYAEAVGNLKLRHPSLTGLGKWVWDARRLVDYIETVPALDAGRIGMIGHSLGGKMTLYATAFDPRIRVAVASEPGIGLSFSNYEDFWYLGENIKRLPAGSDHHDLLALIAPRPFLLIGGDSADNDKSWRYIHAVKPLYGNPDHIGYLNHRKGHSPTPESVWRAMEWLRRFLTESGRLLARGSEESLIGGAGLVALDRGPGGERGGKDEIVAGGAAAAELGQLDFE